MPGRISMTKKQRDALLALPETENEVIRHYTLDAADLATIAGSRTPETLHLFGRYDIHRRCLAYRQSTQSSRSKARVNCEACEPLADGGLRGRSPPGPSSRTSWPLCCAMRPQ